MDYDNAFSEEDVCHPNANSSSEENSSDVANDNKRKRRRGRDAEFYATKRIRKRQFGDDDSDSDEAAPSSGGEQEDAVAGPASGSGGGANNGLPPGFGASDLLPPGFGVSDLPPGFRAGTTTKGGGKGASAAGAPKFVKSQGASAERTSEDAHQEFPGSFPNNKRDEGAFWEDPFEAHLEQKRKQKQQREEKAREQTKSRQVILHGLVNAAHLNGKIGYVGDDVAFGCSAASETVDQELRISVMIRGGPSTQSWEEKKVRKANVKLLHTNSVGRIRDLQGAKELNGKLCQIGNYNLEAGRYDCLLLKPAPVGSEGELEVKRIKDANLEVVRNYDPILLPEKGSTKCAISRAFVEKEFDVVMKNLSAATSSSSSSRSAPRTFGDLPYPALVRLKDLADALEDSAGPAATGVQSAATFDGLMSDLPTTSSRPVFEQLIHAQDHGGPRRHASGAPLLKPKIVLVSLGRFEAAGQPSAPQVGRGSGAGSAGAVEVLVGRMKALLKKLCEKYRAAIGSAEQAEQQVHFLFPHLAVKRFPLLRQLLAQYWPCYVKSCSEVIVLAADDADEGGGGGSSRGGSAAPAFTSAWQRLDLILAEKLGKTVYRIRGGESGCAVADDRSGTSGGTAEDSASFLYSNKKAVVVVPDPAQGMVANAVSEAHLKEFAGRNGWTEKRTVAEIASEWAVGSAAGGANQAVKLEIYDW
eukprot:g4066.t1